jgi:large conductance mechanosensitive channel
MVKVKVQVVIEYEDDASTTLTEEIHCFDRQEAMPVVGTIFGGLDFNNYFIPLAGQAANNLVDARKAGAVLAYGSFLTVALNFAILAFIIFMMVRQINKLKAEAPAAPPAATPEDVMLLREIRDSLRK